MTGVTVRILPMPNVKEAKVWKSSYANYKIRNSSATKAQRHKERI